MARVAVTLLATGFFLVGPFAIDAGATPITCPFPGKAPEFLPQGPGSRVDPAFARGLDCAGNPFGRDASMPTDAAVAEARPSAVSLHGPGKPYIVASMSGEGLFLHAPLHRLDRRLIAMQGPATVLGLGATMLLIGAMCRRRTARSRPRRPAVR